MGKLSFYLSLSRFLHFLSLLFCLCLLISRFSCFLRPKQFADLFLVSFHVPHTTPSPQIIPMSCNGCRVLRKGCSDSCILRHSLQWIETPESQGHATVFVAKFFGRAGLMSFISGVPQSHRPALFQSLLFEACGRTVNPVNGAVGLLWTGNWHVCQAAVETVLRGGALRAMPELLGGGPQTPASDEASETCTDMWRLKDPINSTSRFSNPRPTASPKRKRVNEDVKLLPEDLNLCLTPTFPVDKSPSQYKRRPETPSMNSDESETTTCFESSFGDQYGHGSAVADERRLLNLFV